MPLGLFLTLVAIDSLCEASFGTCWRWHIPIGLLKALEASIAPVEVYVEKLVASETELPCISASNLAIATDSIITMVLMLFSTDTEHAEVVE